MSLTSTLLGFWSVIGPIASALIMHVYHKNKAAPAKPDVAPTKEEPLTVEPVVVPTATPALGGSPLMHRMLQSIEGPFEAYERAQLHALARQVFPPLEPFLDPAIDQLNKVVEPLAEGELEKLAGKIDLGKLAALMGGKSSA